MVNKCHEMWILLWWQTVEIWSGLAELSWFRFPFCVHLTELMHSCNWFWLRSASCLFCQMRQRNGPLCWQGYILKRVMLTFLCPWSLNSKIYFSLLNVYPKSNIINTLSFNCKGISENLHLCHRSFKLKIFVFLLISANYSFCL